MMSSDEVREYKNLYHKFCRTCFDLGDLMRKYIPEFPMFADWKVGDNGTISALVERTETCVIRSVEFQKPTSKVWSFPSILLELDKEVIEGLLKENPKELYSVREIDL